MIAHLLLTVVALAAPQEDRLRQLERELGALRARVEALEGVAKGKAPAPVAESPATGAPCSLRTAFDGTFSGATAAAVVEACRAKTKSGIYCQEKDVRCAR